MALNLEDEQTDRHSRELAQATDESITVATRRAIEERLARARTLVGPRNDEIRELIARGRTRQILDGHDADAILGSGADRLPA